MSERLRYGAWCWISKAVLSAALVLSLALPARAEKVHLMALGDSLTQGYGLLDHEGFVAQLRAWLAARGHDVRVVNAGVSGDTTAGGLARVEWSLTPEIGGMILALGGNDLLRGFDPAVTRQNLAGILDIAAREQVEVLLIGLEAPLNYGPGYKRAFEAIFPGLAAEYGTLMEPNFLGGLRDDAAPMGRYMQSDGLHPNADGVARIVEALGPSVEALIARVQARDQP